MPQSGRELGEVFIEYTKSICPVCKVVVDAEVNIRDDMVFMRKRAARTVDSRRWSMATRRCTWTPLGSTSPARCRCNSRPT